MALPQKAIEQLGREPVKTPGWSARILMFSSVIFFFSLAIYLGVSFGYEPYLQGKLTDIEDQITRFGERVPVSEQQKIINFYSQLVNLRTLLANQKYASAGLPWLEAHTHPNVYFTSFSFDLTGGNMSVGAKSRSVDDVAEQLVSLENLPELKNVVFTGTSAGDDKIWNFSLGLNFVQEFFLNPEKFANTPGNNAP